MENRMFYYRLSQMNFRRESSIKMLRCNHTILGENRQFILSNDVVSTPSTWVTLLKWGWTILHVLHLGTSHGTRRRMTRTGTTPCRVRSWYASDLPQEKAIFSLITK